jgi:hypothetical protein
MSRSIDIEFKDPISGATTVLEIRNPYSLFGTQQSSKTFWSLPEIEKLGIKRLTELGHLDPIYFQGWEDLALLRSEIDIIIKNIDAIPFRSELKAEWLSHLVYCYALLVQSAPNNSVPRLTIG